MRLARGICYTESMRHRKLGRTGLEVSELGLGTWGLSGEGYGPVGEADQDRVIERARILGVTLFETADSYARGAMERRLGRLVGNDPEVRIVTKVGTDLEAAPARKRFDRSFLEQSMARAAERLGRSRLDVVLLHNPSLGVVERGEATDLLAEAETKDKIAAWGVSAGSVDVARAAMSKGARVISLAYNVLWSRELREIGSDLARLGVGAVVHSVLAYGLLAGLWASDKQFAPDDHRSERWTPDDLRRRLGQLAAVRPLVGGPVLTLRAAAVRYVLENSLVSAAIIGPRSCLQLDQLVREAGKGPPYLPTDKIRALEARLRELGVNA
jgi:aryl-alcohol dehydrogenase-like predicted oxidoreductase